jgi:hypothetical protein
LPLYLDFYAAIKGAHYVLANRVAVCFSASERNWRDRCRLKAVAALERNTKWQEVLAPWQGAFT